jgi:hypothetical protein
MALRDGSADGQAQAGPAGLSAPCRVDAIKALEDVREVLGGDPDPRVSYGQLGESIPTLAPYFDPAPSHSSQGGVLRAN